MSIASKKMGKGNNYLTLHWWQESSRKRKRRKKIEIYSDDEGYMYSMEQ